MTASFSSLSIPPPVDWQDFQRQCRAILSHVWHDPHCAQYGREGQAQRGIDILGHRNQDRARPVAAQCKLRNKTGRSELKTGDLDEVIAQADSECQIPLTELVIATTASRDRTLTDYIEGKNPDRIKNNLWPITLLFWQDLLELANDQPQLRNILLPQIDKWVRDQSAALLNEKAASTTIVSGVGLELLQRRGTKHLLDVFEVHANEDFLAILRLLEEGFLDQALTKAQVLRVAAFEASDTALQARALSIVAAVHVERGDDQAAVTVLREASSIDTSGEVGRSCRITACLIEKNFDGAFDEAVRATSLYPASERLWARRIMCSVARRQDDRAIHELPSTVDKSARVLHALAWLYLDRDDFPQALQCAQQACQADPSNVAYALTYCDSVASKLFINDHRGHLGEVASQDRAAAEDAVQRVMPIWKRVLETAPTQRTASLAMNLPAILSALDRHPEAIEVASRASSWIPADVKVQRQHAVVLLRADRIPEAIEILKTSPLYDSVSEKLLLAELQHVSADVAGTKLTLEAVDVSLLDGPEKAQFLMLTCRHALKSDNSSVPEKAIAELRTLDPAYASIIEARVAYGRGDRDALEQHLRSAAASALAQRDVRLMSIVADNLCGVGLYADAAPLLEHCIAHGSVGDQARLLAACYAETDDRRKLSQLLESLPEPFASSDRFIKLKILVAERNGELQDALRLHQSLVDRHPAAARYWLEKILLLRRTDRPAARTELLQFERREFATIEERSLLVSLLHDENLLELALEQAFVLSTRYQNAWKAQVPLVGLIMTGGKAIEAIVASPVVGPNVVMTLTRLDPKPNDSAQVTYLLDNAGVRVENEGPVVIGSTDPIAINTRNRRVGENVTILTTDGSQESFVIKELKSKYLDRFQRCWSAHIGNFQEHGFVQPAPITTGTSEGEQPEGEQSFESRLREKREFVGEIEQLYERAGIPAWMAFQCLGGDPIDNWLTWTTRANRQFRMCLGTASEREEAFEVLRSNEHGLVIDPMDLVLLVEGGCAKHIARGFGALALPQTSLDRLRAASATVERRVTQPQSVVFLNDSGMPQMAVSNPQVDARFAKLLRDATNFAERECVLVSSKPMHAMTADWCSITEAIPDVAVDLIYAAEGTGATLLSSDLGLRAIAQEQRSVRGVWLQVCLLAARDQGQLSHDLYARLCELLASKSYSWLCVDHATVLTGLRQTYFDPSSHLKMLLNSGLDLRRAEPRGAVDIALRCFRSILDEPGLGHLQREASILAVINGLTGDARCKDPRVVVAIVLKAVNNPILRSVLLKWLCGHFLLP